MQIYKPVRLNINVLLKKSSLLEYVELKMYYSNFVMCFLWLSQASSKTLHFKSPLVTLKFIPKLNLILFIDTYFIIESFLVYPNRFDAILEPNAAISDRRIQSVADKSRANKVTQKKDGLQIRNLKYSFEDMKRRFYK